MKTSGLESMQFNDEDEDEEHVVNKEEMEIFFVRELLNSYFALLLYVISLIKF